MLAVREFDGWCVCVFLLRHIIFPRLHKSSDIVLELDRMTCVVYIGVTRDWKRRTAQGLGSTVEAVLVGVGLKAWGQ